MNDGRCGYLQLSAPGPAGVSAAITAKVRGKTVLLFGSRELSSKLTKAHKIQNYPGLPDIDVPSWPRRSKSTWMCWKSQSQRSGRRCMPWAYFGIQTPDAMLEASSVILAGGVVMGKPFPKKDELLGRGVSFCATCDAHFTPEKPLQSWDTTRILPGSQALWQKLRAGCCISLLCPTRFAVNDHVQVINERPIAILGQTHAESVQTGKNTYAVDGVFVLGCCCTGQVGAGLAVEGM